jgi:signal transduction histidine kinase
MSNFASQAEGLSRLANGLRTPLALIVGYAELLLLEPDDETRADAPARIKEAAADLARVVDDMLTVYAIDAGVLYLAPSPVDARAFVDDAVTEARERGINVTVEASDRVAARTFLADRDQATTMLLNLLENARRRAANAGATVHVRSASGLVEIEVGDRGETLDEKEAEAAFDAFSRVTPRTGLTTGLELYKVRRLAELQNGRVWVRSESSVEVRFGFALPIAKGPRRPKAS